MNLWHSSQKSGMMDDKAFNSLDAPHGFAPRPGVCSHTPRQSAGSPHEQESVPPGSSRDDRSQIQRLVFSAQRL